MNEILLQYGALGLMVIGLTSITYTLWQENRELRTKYVELLKLVLEQQKDFVSTLDKLSDGMAAQDLIRQYIERQGREEND